MWLDQLTSRGDFRLSPAFTPPSDSERVLLGLLFRNGPTSQADVTRAMNLTQSTVSRLVAGLLGKGLIEAGVRPPSGRGQPSALLSLKSDHAYALGISLVGDALSAELIDFSGQRLWRANEPLTALTRDAVTARLRTLKRDMLRATGIDPRRLFAAGIGFSGFFVGEGPLMNPPEVLDDWALMDMAPILSEALDLPVLVDNDGNVAAIGEALCGAGRRYRNFVYFQITNGFGGGVVIDGKPYRGTFGNAGEFAVIWQAVGIEHPNLIRLRTLVAEHGTTFDSLSALLANVTPEHPGAQAWLEEAARAFSIAAAAASAVMDCEAVVLGGRLPKPLAEALAGRIHIAGTQRRGRPKPLPVIVPSEAPEGDAVSVGAAVFALQSTFFV